MVSATVPLQRSEKELNAMNLLEGNPQFLRKFAAEVVQEAFRQRRNGDNTRFEDLRRGFACKPSASDAVGSIQLQFLLVALTQQISLLEANSVSLVKSIIAMNWLGRSAQFVHAYTRFLGSLVSSHAEYSTMVIQMLVQHMTLLHQSIGRLPNHDDVSKDEIYARVHTALSYVLELVPFAKESLVNVIIAEYPHKSERDLAQTTYIGNLLKLTRYVPSIEGAVLNVIIEKVISIDVEIQVDLEDLELDLEEQTLQQDDQYEEAASDLDVVEFEDQTFEDEDDHLEATEVQNMTVQCINENIKKLDNVLTILFDHLYRTFSNLPKYVDESVLHTRYAIASATFESLLLSLDSTILKTYQSRYTQFLLFWSAQMHPIFTDQFLGVIAERALDHTRPATHRMIAASYIGSFTARAATLDRSMVRMLANMMSTWINGFLDGKEGDHCGSRDAVKRFGIFYAMIQALFYVFCFRWRELSGSSDSNCDDNVGSVTWLPGLQRTIERAIYNRTLNPLRYCNSTIIRQFARVSHHLDFVFCGTIIEANKRTCHNGVGEIDSYFPFDPYGLKRSKGFVDTVYQQWHPVPGMDEDEDDEDEDESDIEE